MKEIKFTIPLTPVTKKNSQQIITKTEQHIEMIGKKAVAVEKNKPIPLASPKFRAYQDESGWYIPCRGQNLKGPLAIKCLFHMPTRRRKSF